MKPAVVTGIIVLALGSYFGYHVAYVSPGKSLEQVQLQAKEAEQEQELRAQVAASLKALEQARRKFAQRSDSDWLLQEVSKLGQEAGFQVTSITPQAPQKIGEYTQLAVSMQLETTYHQLGRFLSRIERTDSVIHVDDLDVTVPPRGETGRIQVRLVLSALHVPPVASLMGSQS